MNTGMDAGGQPNNKRTKLKINNHLVYFGGFNFQIYWACGLHKWWPCIFSLLLYFLDDWKWIHFPVGLMPHDQLFIKYFLSHKIIIIQIFCADL